MNDKKRNNLYDEKIFNNPHDLIEIKNKEKLKLRKNKLNIEIQNKRKQKLAHINLDLETNLNSELRFKINKFEDSYIQVFNYLNSNNDELISYALSELKVYFCFNNTNTNDQKIIMENKLFILLLNLGYKFINSKDKKNLELILWTLNNIQSFDKGSIEYFDILYSKEYLDFYYKSLAFGDNIDFFNLIITIINNLIGNNYTLNNEDKNNNINFNLNLLRSPIFSLILDFLEEEKNTDNQSKNILLRIIKFCVDLEDIEYSIEDNDIKIVDRCFKLLVEYVCGSNSEENLNIIYRTIFNISNLDNKYKFNKKIIDEGITLKILKYKFHNIKIDANIIDIIDFGLRIIANNLTISDKDCKIIYDSNIIDYYNNILFAFKDNFKIARDIFTGLANISVGSKKNLIITSSIWEENNIQKYCNMNDEFIISYIRITTYLTYHADYETLKFIYKTKILQYLIFIFTASNIRDLIIYEKILRLINTYLEQFKDDKKESEEFKMIFHKFIDLIQSSDKINELKCLDIIKNITENIKNKYK